MTERPDLEQRAREIVDVIFADIRGRKLLKWFFPEEPDDAAYVCSHFQPITADVQEEIAETWRRIITKALASSSVPEQDSQESQNVPAPEKKLPKSGRKFPLRNGQETLSLKAPAVECRTVSLTLREVAEIFIAGCQRGSDEAIAFERGSAASGARDDDLAAALCEIINNGKRWGEPGYIAYGTLAQVWDNALAARAEEDAQ